MQINCLKQRSKVDAPKIIKGIEVISPQVAPDWRCGPSPGLNHDTQLWAEALQTEALQTEPKKPEPKKPEPKKPEPKKPEQTHMYIDSDSEDEHLLCSITARSMTEEIEFRLGRC